MPTIQQITVRAGRCVQHPLHSYGHIKADIELVATLDAGEDPDQVRRDLQLRVESDIEQHLADLRDSIEDMSRFSATRNRIERLESETARLSAEKERLEQELAEATTPLPLFAPRQAPKSTAGDAD